jgi:integrase/recombinase XerD
VFDRKGGRKYLNEAERLAFLHAAQGEPEKARRAFCLTLLHTGCRISEALGVISERVDLSQKSVVFETLKRRRKGVFRAVPIPDSLTGLLNEIREGTNSSACLWKFSRPTAYRMIKECMKRAGVTGGMASPKGLRHGFAVACLSHNIPLTTVQKWLGHARLETTAIYVGVSGEEERNLAKRLWPKES